MKKLANMPFEASDCSLRPMGVCVFCLDILL